MTGYQLSGDAPSLYARFAGKVTGTFTDELIQAGTCGDPNTSISNHNHRTVWS